MTSALYDRIGSAYDATRCADSYIVGRLLAELGVAEGRQYVDVACGTGNYSWALAAAGVSVTGVDASRRMISAAASKSRVGAAPWNRASRGPSSPEWVVGDVACLPFASRSFAGATCTLALRYFADLEGAAGELARIIDGGRLVIFTATPDQIHRYWLREYFPTMLARVAAEAHPLSQIRAALGTAGFVNVRTAPYWVRRDVEDLFLYSGKHRPELYLNPSIRAGMWSFNTLVPPEEEAAGCAALRRDINSGRIHAVMRSAEGDSMRERLSEEGQPFDDTGDYLFVVADRNPPSAAG